MKCTPWKFNTLGFTLVEMLLVIALLAVVGGISVPLYYTFQVRNDLDIVATSYAHALRRASTLARAVDGDVPWGVHLSSTAITLFKGASFSVRDSSFDEISDIPASISPTGVQEIVFARFTGLPQVTGLTTFTSTSLESRNVVINEKGMVSY